MRFVTHKNMWKRKGNTMKQKTQFGRSMIDMLGVLAIVGVLSVGGLVGYQKAMHKHTVDDFIYGLQQTWTEVLSRPKVKAPSGDDYIDRAVLCNTIFIIGSYN